MSWSIKVDDEARAAAQEAARQAGVSLDEWLRQAITARAAETARFANSPVDRDENERRAMADLVGRLARRIKTMSANARSAVPGLADRLGEIENALSQIDAPARGDERRGVTLRGIAGMVDRLARDLDDADESARTTVEGLRSAGGAAHMESTSSVADVIRRLDTSITAMAERSQPAPSRNDSLEELRARLDELLAATPKPQKPPKPLKQQSLAAGLDRTLKDLETRIQEASARIESRQESRMSAGSEDERVRRIEARLSEIAARLAAGPPPAAGDDDLSDAIAEIAERRAERDRVVEANRAANAAVQETLQALRDDVARLEQRMAETALEAAAGDESHASLIHRIDELTAEAPRDRALLNEIRHELEVLGTTAAGTAREATLLDRIDDLVRHLPDVDAATEGLAREATLLTRFDELSRRLPDRGKLDALGEEVASLRWLLESDDSPQAVARLEMRVSELARTIETTLRARHSTSEAIAVGMASSLADIRGALEDIVASQGRGPDMAAIPGLAANLADIRSTVESMVANRTASPDGATIAGLAAGMEEIRQILDARDAADHQREEMALGRLEGRLDDIAGRLDGALSRIPAQDLVEGLHARLERLATAIEGLNIHAADPGALDEIRTEIATIRRDIAEREPPRFDDLESQIHDLAARMEAASRPEADAGQLAELETRIDAVAAELDRAAPRTEALKHLEENLLRLQAGLSDGRQESVEAARTAARDAVREFATRNADHELLEALRHDLDQISKVVGDTSERTGETIESLHGALATVVERLGRLEGETDASEAVTAVAATGTFGAGPALSRDAPPPVDPPIRPSHDDRAERRKGESREVKSDLAALRELAASAADPDRKPTDRRADFIAAARRAAQAAVAEADSASEPPDREAEQKVSPFARIGHAIRNRKKPLLLAAAAIVLALGALQVFGPRSQAPKTTAAVKPVAIERPVAAQRPAVHGEDAAGAPTVPRVDEAALVAPPANARTAMELAHVTTIDDRFSNVFAGGDKSGAGETATHAVSATIPQDPKLPLVGSDRLRAAAAAGDPAAAFEIANRFAEGHDVSKDLSIAASWYQHAAEAGLAVAQYRLGSLYERGQGVEKDLGKAVNWYQRAADQGNVGAMHNLAVLMSEGVGDGPDNQKALEWFLAAANYGVKDSQYNLGVIYARGLGPGQGSRRILQVVRGRRRRRRQRRRRPSRRGCGDALTRRTRRRPRRGAGMAPQAAARRGQHRRHTRRRLGRKRHRRHRRRSEGACDEDPGAARRTRIRSRSPRWGRGAEDA